MARSALIHRSLLAVAIGVFVVSGLRQTEALGSWHEELSVFPRPTYIAAGPTGSEGEVSLRFYCAPDANGELAWSIARPRLSFCYGGTAYPVMVESYFSGIFYWPAQLLSGLHHGDPFRLRKLGLWLGVASLLLGYALVTRLSDERTAALSMLVASSSSPFVTLHALLVPYETVPWIFVMCAILVLGRDPLRAPRARVWLMCALLGFAVLANIKALFLVAPLVGLALWRDRGPLRRALSWNGLVGVLIFVLATSPMWLAAVLDPARGFSGQVGARFGTLLRKLALTELPAEFVNMLAFGADMCRVLTGENPEVSLRLFVVGAAVIWSWVHLWRWVRGRSSNLLGTLCGALTLTFLLVSQLLYDQRPSANYSPIYLIYGMSIGGMFAAFFTALARRGRISERIAFTGVVVAACGIAVSGMHLQQRRLESLRPMYWPVNYDAQHEFTEYLRARDTAVQFITLTYNAAGLPEALAPSGRPVVECHLVLDPCLRNADSEADAMACVRVQLGTMLDLLDEDTVELLAPMAEAMIDPDYSESLGRAVRGVEGWSWRQVHASSTRHGHPVFEVLRGERAALN